MEASALPGAASAPEVSPEDEAPDDVDPETEAPEDAASVPSSPPLLLPAEDEPELLPEEPELPPGEPLLEEPQAGRRRAATRATAGAKAQAACFMGAGG